MRSSDVVRGLVPRAARERLYALHPGRGRRWRQYPGLETVPRTGHAVLTFDDGPDDNATPAVLDRLEEADAEATFFVVGSQLARSPELGQEILRRGHEIGLHGYGHERHDRIDSARSAQDIQRSFSVVEDLLGVRCRWYRPPYGKMSTGAWAACQQLGMTVVYWSGWGLDWEPVPAKRIAEVVSPDLVDGAIILLHDSALYAKRSSAQPTVDAIPAIVDRARGTNVRLATLGDCVSAAEAVGA